MGDEEELFAQLEDVFRNVDEDEIENIQEVDTLELMDRIHEYTAQLAELRERLAPQTQRGRDLHSKLYACRIELSRRKIPGYSPES